MNKQKNNLTITPRFQVITKDMAVICKINDFDYLHSNSGAYYSDKPANTFLKKGINKLDLYVKPFSDEKNCPSIKFSLRGFLDEDASQGLSSSGGYEDSKSEADLFYSNPGKGGDIVFLALNYEHEAGEYKLNTSRSELPFNLIESQEQAVVEPDNSGDYFFDSVMRETLSDGIEHFELIFELREDRPYTPILVQETIAESVTPNARNKFGVTLDEALLPGLMSEYAKVYSMLADKNESAWGEYVASMNNRFTSCPLFEGITPNGLTVKFEIDGYKDYGCELKKFPYVDEEKIYGSLAFDNSVAFIKNAIVYKFDEYAIRKEIRLYYSLCAGEWTLSYIELK